MLYQGNFDIERLMEMEKDTDGVCGGYNSLFGAVLSEKSF